MKKLLIYILATIAFIIAVGYFSNNKSDFVKTLPTPSPIAKKSVKIKDLTLAVEVVDNEITRSKGLSQRDSLGYLEGMLFVFETPDVVRKFWMKDMRFPIDIIWINDGKIAKIDHKVAPESNKPDDQLTVYSSQSPVDYVLEVNSGFCEQNGIKVGESVEINL